MLILRSAKAPRLLVATSGLLVVTATAALIVLRMRRVRGLLSHEIKCPAGTPCALVIVIGLGGVGSHAAHLLLRGGVRKLRLIDFDQVSLSSLNRHATATRADVGTSKATALRKQLLRICPHAEVEACTHLFSAKYADELLRGRPALVVDCIDDLATKTVRVH